jgi:cystathionine beta-lyase/cystathionine gamma-synthase
MIAATKPIHAEKLAFMQKTSGAILSPFECWLVLRGVKSLAVRMEKHDENGRAVAEFLRNHAKVKQVLCAVHAESERALTVPCVVPMICTRPK